MPLSNTSQAISPTSGCAAICASACSPLPNPTSSHSLGRSPHERRPRIGRLLRRERQARQGDFEQAELARSQPVAAGAAVQSVGRRLQRPRADLSAGTRSVFSHVKVPFSLIRLAAEMTVGRGGHVDRSVQMQMLANAARRQVHQVAQASLDARLVHVLAGVLQVDIDRQRTRDADRVADLDGAAIGQSGRHDVLRQIAAGIGGGAVHLGRVLAAERAAAMRGGTAIGIDDDLASGQSAVAVRAADDELAGRVHMELGLGAHPALRAACSRTIGQSMRLISACSRSSTCWVETTTLVAPTGLPSM